MMKSLMCHSYSSKWWRMHTERANDLWHTDRLGWKETSFCLNQLMMSMVVKNEAEGALCWWNTRWWQDGRQMEKDQDNTLVFCESTSCMLMTSVLTPLSYMGLSKADSSVMLSYGGKDVGILIDFPCSLGKSVEKQETFCKDYLCKKWNT